MRLIKIYNTHVISYYTILLYNNSSVISTNTILLVVIVCTNSLFFVSAIFHQTFAQESDDDIYEGLGIKMKYFDPWTILTSSDDTNCYTKDFCMLILGIDSGQGMGQIWITEDRENSPKIMYQCKCDTLKDYVRYVYTNTISKFDNFSFVGDNQTTLSIGNISAIQLEYEFSLDDIQIHAFTIFTKNNDSFYQFTYYAIPSSFSKYLNDFKQMVNSLEFSSSTKETNKKKQQPSFMDEGINNNKTSKENENAQDVLNMENDSHLQQKQKQEKQKQNQQELQQELLQELQQQQQQKIKEQQQLQQQQIQQQQQQQEKQQRQQ